MVKPRLAALTIFGGRFAVASVLVLTLAACGGSNGAPATAVEPAAYVRNVCGAMVQWQEDVGAAFGAKFTETNDSATIRKEVLRSFDTIRNATDALGTRVEKAGTPKATDGERIARQLRETVVTASTKLAGTRARFAAIEVTDVEPAIHLEGAMIEQGDQVDAVSGSLERLDGSPELRRERSTEPACIKFDKQK